MFHLKLCQACCYRLMCDDKVTTGLFFCFFDDARDECCQILVLRSNCFALLSAICVLLTADHRVHVIPVSGKPKKTLNPGTGGGVNWPKRQSGRSMGACMGSLD